MPPETVKIDSYDEKVNMVIGSLMMRADALSKTVITAYDPSKDRTINKSVLGGSRLQTSALNACMCIVHYVLASQLKIPMGVFIVINHH